MRRWRGRFFMVFLFGRRKGVWESLARKGGNTSRRLIMDKRLQKNALIHPVEEGGFTSFWAPLWDPRALAWGA